MTPGSSYQQPPSPRHVGSVWRRGKIVGLAALFLFHWGITQWVAGAFLADGLLPEYPCFNFLGRAIYKPWHWALWEWHFWRWAVAGTTHGGTALRYALLAGIFGSFFVWRLVPGIATWAQVKWLSRNLEGVYGTAKWAELKAIIAAGLLPRKGQSLIGGIVLGLWAGKGAKDGVYLRDKSARHVLLAAASGTGKTASSVLLSALDWAQSMFVVDIKDEIYKATAGWRQSQGHVVVRFAPLEPETSAHINPLDFIRVGTRYEVSDAQKFCQALCDPGGEAVQNSHWNDTAAMLLGGVVLHEMYKCRLKFNRSATMADIGFGLSPYRAESSGSVTAVDFCEYLKGAMRFEHDPDGRNKWKLQDGSATKTHPFVIDAAAKALSRPQDEAGSVLSSAAKRFALYADPLIREVTSHTDISIMDLVDGPKPVTFYFVVPPSEKERLAPVTRVMAANIISRLTEKERTWKYELLMLMDEFPSLGYVKPLESALSYTRSYGIRFFLICQDLGQIYKVYGDRNEILPNCQMKMLFATGDLETAEKASKALGDTTILHASFNYSDQKMIPDGKGISAMSQQHHRMLLTPGEIMQLRLPVEIDKKVVEPGDFILQVFGHPPIRGIQGFWFFDPVYSKRVGLPIDPVRFGRPKSLEAQLREALADPDDGIRKLAEEWAVVASVKVKTVVE